LAKQIAADDKILWLIVDKGHERGDDNVKELIKRLDLPQRSAYFYGNGAERGFDLAFQHIRRNSITGTVYLADADHAHHPSLWEVLRRRRDGDVGLLPVGVGDRSAAAWKSVPPLSGVAFGAERLHGKEPRSWGKEFIESLYPPEEVRDKIFKGEQPPAPYSCLPGPCSAKEVLLTVPASGQNELPAAWPQPGLLDSCVDIPGERSVEVVPL